MTSPALTDVDSRPLSRGVDLRPLDKVECSSIGQNLVLCNRIVWSYSNFEARSCLGSWLDSAPPLSEILVSICLARDRISQSDDQFHYA